jgi:hypothetical protein
MHALRLHPGDDLRKSLETFTSITTFAPRQS